MRSWRGAGWPPVAGHTPPSGLPPRRPLPRRWAVVSCLPIKIPSRYLAPHKACTTGNAGSPTPRFAGSDRKRLAVGRPEFDNIGSVGLRTEDCELVLVGHGGLSITSCPANLRIAHRPSATPNPTAAATRCRRRGKEASRIRLRSQRPGAGYISSTAKERT